MSARTMKILAAVLAVVGILAIVAGVMYFTIPARDLPSFFPGHLPSNSIHHFHRKSRGVAGVIFGAVVLAVAAGMAYVSRRDRTRSGQNY
jgi:uncharacterized membrane protein YedE/YeeE